MKLGDVRICDSCSTAAYDAGCGNMRVTTQFLIMQEIGGELADHLCDEIETDGEIKCNCGCHRETKFFI
jgi:hypothetical protein